MYCNLKCNILEMINYHRAKPSENLGFEGTYDTHMQTRMTFQCSVI